MHIAIVSMGKGKLILIKGTSMINVPTQLTSYSELAVNRKAYE